jgi:hypothetical protein
MNLRNRKAYCKTFTARRKQTVGWFRKANFGSLLAELTIITVTWHYLSATADRICGKGIIQVEWFPFVL